MQPIKKPLHVGLIIPNRRLSAYFYYGLAISVFVSSAIIGGYMLVVGFRMLTDCC